MTFELSSASDVRAWLSVAPERHREVLSGLWRLWPQWRGVFEEAVR